MSDASVRVPEISTKHDGREVDCETIVRDGVTYYRQRTDSQLKYLDVSTGLEGYVKGHDGMVHTVDYLNTISVGLLPNHSRFSGRGRRDALAITAGGDDISDIAGVAIPIPDQTVGEQFTFVSDNANDTAAGTGARSVKLHYLTAAGVYGHEIVTMNGLTPVNTVATNGRFIQEISVETLGIFGGKSAGNIVVYRTGDPTRVYARIVAGNNVSLSTARMIPAGVTFYMKSMSASATSGKPVSVRITATCDHNGVYTPGVFQFNEIMEMQDSTISINFGIPRKIPQLAIMKAIAVSTQAGGSVAVSYDGWTEV